MGFLDSLQNRLTGRGSSSNSKSGNSDRLRVEISVGVLLPLLRGRFLPDSSKFINSAVDEVSSLLDSIEGCRPPKNPLGKIERKESIIVASPSPSLGLPAQCLVAREGTPRRKASIVVSFVESVRERRRLRWGDVLPRTRAGRLNDGFRFV